MSQTQLLRTWLGLAAGPVAAAVVFLAAATTLPAPTRFVAALAVWMALWWLAAPLPLAVTALLPLVLLPLAGGAGVAVVARRYADPIVFLFLGGFMLGAASERWGLHRRLAYGVIGLVGGDARRVVLALMVATGLISMWISNTATAALMLPLTLAVLELGRREAPESARRLGAALVLGMAYAASIGGVATLIGTPPTAIFAGAARTIAGRPVGFAEWLLVGLPIAVALLGFAWWLLVWVLFPVRGTLRGLAEHVRRERAVLGTWAPAERCVVIVLIATALAWVLREPKAIGGLTMPGLTSLAPGLSDAGIAVIAAAVLVVLPPSLHARRLALDWGAARRIRWDVLVLFGGGLALAAAFETSGLAAWLAGRLAGLAGAPAVLVIGAVTLFFVLLTELTSNTATAAMAMPLAAALAPALGAEPLALMAAAALGSAMGFMLPVGTPPNALAYGSGAVTRGEMARAGVWLDVVGAVVITVAVWLWAG